MGNEFETVLARQFFARGNMRSTMCRFRALFHPMTPALEHLRQQARLLSPNEREALLTVLEHDMRDLPEHTGTAKEAEEAWEEEISRRVREVESGKAQLIPHEQVMAELRAHLAVKRRSA